LKDFFHLIQGKNPKLINPLVAICLIFPYNQNTFLSTIE